MLDGYRIIDAHGHVGSWQQYGMDDGLDGVLHMMDRGGVDVACLFNVFWGEARRGNDALAAFVQARPDRFIGFAFVTPHYPEEMVPELERAVDRLGFKGIKIYPPYFPLPVSDPVWDPVFAFANERGLPLLSHTWGGDAKCCPSLFVPLAERYPNVSWIVGHAGGTGAGRGIAVEAARKVPNLYLEICSSWRNPGAIEDLVSGAGADRVLYGSDLPLIEPRVHVGRVMTADLSEADRRKVLGENVARILKM
ncbi:MAG: amidohydrolase [Candidatus Latescibacteria bacterium]|nr:amidohydrolase [Candidatus Latescibacterota bacterium]